MISSVGSVGDSYDNALAETINELYEAEVIHKRGPWRTVDEVEYATLEWVDLIGSTTSGRWSPLAAYLRQNTNWRIIANRRGQPWWLESDKRVSGIAGAIYLNLMTLPVRSDLSQYNTTHIG